MHVVDVPPEQVGTHKAGIVEVYRAVFTEPPWNEPADYADGYGERLEFEDAGMSQACTCRRARRREIGWLSARPVCSRRLFSVSTLPLS